MIDSKLLDILACPSCKEDVEYNARENRLECTGCPLAYPVEDGIPVMLIESAIKRENVNQDEK